MIAGATAAIMISGGLAVAVVRAADDTKPANEAVAADRYVVTVSGMT
jgi:hypothetical protein